MVAKLEQMLLDHAGHQTITLPDGVTVSYQNLAKQLAHWKCKVARAAGTRPSAAAFDLSNF